MKQIRIVAQRESNREMINGIEFLVAVSPYFFPELLECNYDSDLGILTIEFKYLIGDDELDTSVKDDDPSVKVFVGSRTGRIQKIEVSVDTHDIDQVVLKVTSSVSGVFESLLKLDPELSQNFLAAKSAITDNGQAIAELVNN